MTIEAFYNFGKSANTLPVRHPKIAERIIKSVVLHSGKVVHMLEPHMGRIAPDKVYVPYYEYAYPKHKALLDPSHRDSTYCHLCNTYTHIYRHAPKLSSSSLEISLKTSTYHPQPLQYCQCKAMATLVDHRGILRVYGEGKNISIVHYLPTGHQLLQHLTLNHYKHAEIPQSVLDGPRPRLDYIAEPPRFLWNTNMIDLSYLKFWETTIVLPVPMSRYSQTIRSTENSFLSYYQNYAYNHKLIILTRHKIFLPNGVYLSTHHPIVDEILSRAVELQPFMNSKTIKAPTIGTVLRSPRRNYKLLEYANQLTKAVYEELLDRLDLPRAPLKEHPIQLAGYLQIIKIHPMNYEMINNRHYVNKMYYSQIKAMRNIAIELLRLVMSNTPTGPYLNRRFHRDFAEIPPMKASMLSKELSAGYKSHYKNPTRYLYFVRRKWRPS